MMKNNILFIILFLLVSCFSSEDTFQIDRSNQNKYIKLKIIKNNVNEEIHNLDLVVGIPVNKLVFYKKEVIFESNITIDLLIENTLGKLVYSDSWTEKISKQYYDDTKSLDIVFLNHPINLKEGEYNFRVIINDFENHINWIKSLSYNIVNQEGLSDISVFYKSMNKYKPILKEELISDNFDTLWIKYLINNFEYEEISLGYEFMNLNLDNNFFYEDNPFNNSNIIILDDNINNHEQVIYKNNIIILNKLNTQISYIPIPIIEDYFDVLKISMNYGNQIRTKVLKFDINDSFEYDYSKLVGPMVYIFDTRYHEFEKLSYEEKLFYVEDYWDAIIQNQIDGKELLKEFYKRVIYSNKNFYFLSKKGWDTDRGKIFIINGFPDEVKRELSQDKEFEIWRYNQREYIFINKYGQYFLYNKL